MRKFIYFLLAISLWSCGEKTKGVDSSIYTEKKVGEFISVNPNWGKNSNNEAQTTEKFKHKIINLSNEADFLTGFPLQLKEVRDTAVSGQDVKLAVFKAFQDDSRASESLLNQIELEIDGIFSIDDAAKLVVGKKYTVKGMLFKQGKRGDIKFSYNDSKSIYNLGKYTFWNMEVKSL